MTFDSASTNDGLSPFAKQLLQQGYISLSQLQQALSLSLQTGRSLPEVVTEMTGEVLPSSLLQQYEGEQRFKLQLVYGVDFLDPITNPPNLEAIAKCINTYLPLAICREHRLLPLQRLNKELPTLIVAMVDPEDELALRVLDQLKRFKLEYQRRGLTLKDYHHLFDQYMEKYPHSSESGDATIVNVTEIMEDSPPQISALQSPPEDELNRPVSAQEAPIVTLVNKILILGLREKATEIHLDPQESKLVVRMRQGGNLRPLIDPLPKNAIAGVIKRLKILAGMDITQTQIPQKARLRKSYSGRPVYFFINTLPSFYGEKFIVRIVEALDRFPDFHDLLTDKQIQKKLHGLIPGTGGLVLVSGPAYAGKSTTMEVFLGQQLKRGLTIGTVEDPIRRAFDDITQVEVNPEQGLSYPAALKLLSNQGLEVILVDNIEDKETAQAVINTVKQGHLVLAGLHAKDTATAIAQMSEWVDAGILADNLHAVINQRLLRRVCPTCRLEHSPEASELKRLGLSPTQSQSSQFYRANTLNSELVKQLQLKGRLCRQCNGAGYHGQVGVYEILQLTPSLRPLLTQKVTPSQLRQAAQAEGMILLVQDALGRVLQGETTLEELIRNFPEAVEALAANPLPGALPVGFQERLDVLEQSLGELTTAFDYFKKLFTHKESVKPNKPLKSQANFDDLMPELLALENLGRDDEEDDSAATLVGASYQELLTSIPKARSQPAMDKEATFVAEGEIEGIEGSGDNTDKEATVVHPFKSIVDPW